MTLYDLIFRKASSDTFNFWSVADNGNIIYLICNYNFLYYVLDIVTKNEITFNRDEVNYIDFEYLKDMQKITVSDDLFQIPFLEYVNYVVEGVVETSSDEKIIYNFFREDIITFQDWFYVSNYSKAWVSQEDFCIDLFNLWRCSSFLDLKISLQNASNQDVCEINLEKGKDNANS